MQQVPSMIMAALFAAAAFAQETEEVYYSSTGETQQRPFTETFASPDVLPE